MGQNPIQQEKRKIRNKEINKLYWEVGLTCRELGKRYNLHFERIRQIIKKRS